MRKKLLVSCISMFSILNCLIAQINMQDGSMTYDIPIYSFADAKSGLSTAINLRYNSGNGLKVNSRASNVGQNWNLMAGGFIVRQQFGEPDDQNSLTTFPAIPVGNVRGFNKDIACYTDNYQSFSWAGDPYSQNYYDNYYPNGYMYSEFPVAIEDQSGYVAGNFMPKSLAVTLRFKDYQDKRFKIGRNALTDREQDIFIFNINGEVGQFVIGKNGVPALLNLDKSKYTIDKIAENLSAQNIRTRIKEFTIKDDKGIEYKFSNYELSEVMEYDEIYVEDDNTSFSKRFSGGTPKGKYVINKWNLTEITNTNTNEKILFSYSNDIAYDNSDLIPSYGNTQGQNSESVNIIIAANKGTKKNLSLITLPNNNTVEFSYKVTPRQDVLNDYPIDKITIKYNSIEQYNCTFNYGYFFNSGITVGFDDLKEYTDFFTEAQQKCLRLYLKSVKKIGTNISEPANEFTYYVGLSAYSLSPGGKIPPYGCLAQDHWGFYTSNSNITNTNFNPTKAELKSLLTNTAYREPSIGSAAVGLLRTIKTPLGATITYEYEQNQAKDADNPALTKNYAGVRVFKITTSPNAEYSAESEKTVTQYSYINADGTSSGWGYETPNYFEQKVLKIWNAGSINGYKYSGRSSQFSSGVGAKAEDDILQAVLSSTKSALLRIAISSLTSPTPKIPHPLTVIHEVLKSLFIKGFITRLLVLSNPTNSYTTSSYNYYSQQYQNSLGVNYARVEEKNISITGGVGKTVYEFTAPSNVRAVAPVLAVPYAPSARIASAQYGLPSSTKVYHQNGTLLKEIQYQYNTAANGFLISENHKSCKIHVNTAESGGADNWSIGNGVPASDFNWQYYYPQVIKTQLTSMTEKNYPASGNISTDISQTFYNSDNLVSKIVTQKSNNIIIEVRKYYPNDFNNINSAIATLKNKNMLNTEIATEKWLIKGTSAFLMDAYVNEYAIAANGEVVLNKVYTLESDAPLSEAIVGLHNPNILIRNVTYYKEQASFNYLSNAVIKETIPKAGNSTVQLFDFGDRIPVASVTNAKYDDVAYTSFETSNLGGWQYNSNSSIAANATLGAAVMGNKFLEFGNGITVNRQVNNVTNYKLSFWQKGTTLYVTYAGIPIAATFSLLNAATGWTYYEYNLTGTGLLSIGKATNDNLFAYADELRLYPKNARMSTVGYDNLLRKTSECDVNNRIQYYEYDGLSRVIIIRNENKNILKKYCYTFNGQQENCLDNTQNEPLWEVQQGYFCEPCVANYNYPSGKRFKWKFDVNPASPTYQTTLQFEDVNNPCPSPADWVLTSSECIMENLPPYGYSGMQTLVYTDINPCSITYNTNQYQTVANTAACPVCASTCTYPQYKCINGTCVQGTLGVIKVVSIAKNGSWNCYYAYCYPDGSTSEVVNTVNSATPCTITCQ
jgi:hypothetical protein